MASGVDDIASLNVAVDTRQVEGATVKFQDLVQAARVVEDALAAVGASARTAGSDLRQQGDNATRVAGGVRSVGEAARSTVSATDGMTAAVRRGVSAYQELVARSGEAGRAVAQFTALRVASAASADQEVARLTGLAGAWSDVAENAMRAGAAVAAASASGGGGAGGGSAPPNGGGPPEGPGGFGGGPPSGDEGNAWVRRVMAQYETRMGKLERRFDPRALEQFTALRQTGANVDLTDLSAEQQELRELAGLYHDVAAAAREADAAERARAQQAASNFRSGLDESFNNFKPQAGSARDSARVFEEAAREAEDYARRADKLRASLSPAEAAQQKFNAAVREADDLLARGSISADTYAAALTAAEARRTAALTPSTADSDREAAELAKLAEKVRAANDPSYGMQRRYEQSVSDADRLRAAGVFGPTEHAQSVAAAGQRLTKDYDDLFAPDRKAAEQEAARAAAEMENLRKRADALRASIDPLAQSQQEFNKTQRNAAELLRAGAISAAEYDKAIEQAHAKQVDFNSKIEEGGKRAGMTGQQYFWMLSNVKDFFNQVYAGGSISTALLQQGPMLAQIMAMGEGGVMGSIKGLGQTAKSGVMATARSFGSIVGLGGGASQVVPDTSPGVPPGMSSAEVLAETVASRVAAKAVAPGASSLASRAAMARGLPAGAVAGVAEAGTAAAVGETATALASTEAAATGATSALGGAGIALGVMGGAAVAAAAGLTFAYYRFDQLSKELNRSTYGVGRRSGATVDQMTQVAGSIENTTTGMSRSTSISAVAALGATGNISAGALPAVAKVVQDYAYTTKQDAVPAAKELGEALDGSSSGIDRLNAKIGFLNSSTREMYLQMAASGDKTGAVRLAVDALSGSLEKANVKLGFFARLWNNIGSGVSNAVTAVGERLDRATGGGTPEELLADARAANASAVSNLESYKRNVAPYSPSFISDRALKEMTEEVERTQKEVDKAQKSMSDFAENARRAQSAVRSIEVDDIVRGMNPLDEQIKKIRANLENLRTARFQWDLPADKIRETELAMQGLSRQLRQIAEDAKYGGAQFNEMVIGAQNAARQVGATAQSRQIMSAQDQAESTRRQADRENVNTSISSATREIDQYRRAIGEGNLSSAEVAGVEQRIKTLEVELDANKKRLAAIDTTRDTQIQSIQQEGRIQSAQAGGAFTRAPQVVQEMLERAQREGSGSRVSLDIMSALIRKESSYSATADANKNFPNSHAYGYTQLQPGTAREVGVNAYDPQDNIRGGLRYLQKMLEMFNNDMFTALAAYNQGPGKTADAIKRTGQVTKEGADYARAIMRDAGIDPGAGGAQTPGATDARRFEERRGAETQRQQVAAEIRFGGNDQYQLDVQTKYLELYNAEFAKTGQVSEQTKAQLLATAQAMAQVNQEASSSRLGKDYAFQLEQMGRTPESAAVYSQVKSALGDTNRAEAQALIGQGNYISNLQTIKGLATDVWGSMSQGIMSGAKASDIALSMLGRLESKLLDMAGNELIAQLFKMLAGGGVGSSGGTGLAGLFGGGGGLGGLFGGGGGGGSPTGGVSLVGASGGIGDIFKSIGSFFGFDRGGVMTPYGAVPLHAYGVGGVARRPQVALFGEGAQHEAYVPLPDNQSIPVTLDGGEAYVTLPGNRRIPVSVTERRADGGIGRLSSFAAGGVMSPGGPTSLASRLPGGGGLVPLSGRTSGASAAPVSGPTFIAQIQNTGSSGDPAADEENAQRMALASKSAFRSLYNEFVAADMRPGGALYQSGARRG